MRLMVGWGRFVVGGWFVSNWWWVVGFWFEWFVVRYGYMIGSYWGCMNWVFLFRVGHSFHCWVGRGEVNEWLVVRVWVMWSWVGMVDRVGRGRVRVLDRMVRSRVRVMGRLRNIAFTRDTWDTVDKVTSTNILVENCSISTLESILFPILMAEVIHLTPCFYICIVSARVRLATTVKPCVGLCHGDRKRLDTLHLVWPCLQQHRAYRVVRSRGRGVGWGWWW